MPHRYLLDANIFIQAHRRYYAFDICPGFWASLPHFFAAGRVLSIDRVRQELLTGDVLDDWVQHTAPAGLFATTAEQPIIDRYSAMMAWAQGHAQYNQAARAEFAQDADAWLIAFAQVHGCVVVTQEVANPDSVRRIPIPNVCNQFGVPFVDTFAMLRDLGIQFGWQPPAAAAGS